ncbi:caspase domain-containing protein [Crassisporium funariophilum]|nr:caspase domain-containing protein [Crassisporium funariophilum]
MSIQHPPKPIKPALIDESTANLHALVIGINEYEHATKLRGAVADAILINDYLKYDLRVPETQIITLIDEEASRKNIIQAFLNLKSNQAIRRGDAILIFYAGHGDEHKPPTGWEAGGSNSKIQSIVPHNFNSTTGHEVHVIPDRTIGALIDEIMYEKGDNITVILDCCHSGSGTRNDDPTRLARTAQLEGYEIPLHLDEDIWLPTSLGRGTQPAKGFARTGLCSHVLLAACSAEELARENSGQGQFTAALIKLFKITPPHQLTYHQALQRIEDIVGQNPQCEGDNRNRIIFSAKAADPNAVFYEVDMKSNGTYCLKAGSAHGISIGAEFTIYADKTALSTASHLAVMVAQRIYAFETILIMSPHQPQLMLDKAVLALQTKAGFAEQLNLYVALDESLMLVFEALLEQINGAGANPRRINLVQDRSIASMEIVREGDELGLIILDQRVRHYGMFRMPHRVRLDLQDVLRVLRAAAHYYYHLNRSQLNKYLQKKVEVQFTQLEISETEFDEFGRQLNVPIGPNLLVEDMISLEVDEDNIYGIKIINNTAWDLYPNVFYFDNSDMSITSYSFQTGGPGKFKTDAPLRKDGGILTLGIGSGGARPFSYFLPPDQDVDVGFLKIFLCTAPTDLSGVPQDSPFHDFRGTVLRDEEPIKTWGSILIPIVQRRKKDAQYKD